MAEWLSGCGSHCGRVAEWLLRFRKPCCTSTHHFANCIVRAASSGDKVQIPWQSWHFVRCDEIDGSLARNIDFEVAIFQVHKKTRRKTSILKLQSVKIGGSLARNARFDAPTSLVSSLWFSCGLALSMGEAAKPLLFEGSKQVVMSFCVAGAALCDIPTCLIECRKSFCVAGAIRLPRFHKMSCSFRGRRSVLEISVVILRGKRSISDVSHCVLYTPHSTYTPHFTLHTPPFTLHTPHFTFHT